MQRRLPSDSRVRALLVSAWPCIHAHAVLVVPGHHLFGMMAQLALQGPLHKQPLVSHGVIGSRGAVNLSSGGQASLNSKSLTYLPHLCDQTDIGLGTAYIIFFSTGCMPAVAYLVLPHITSHFDASSNGTLRQCLQKVDQVGKINKLASQR